MPTRIERIERIEQIRERLSRVGHSTALLLIAAAALVALDLFRFTPATVVSALVLVVFIGAYIVRQPGPRFGLYAFLIAEIGAISLGADLGVALLYQAFALLLLTAIITPFPRLANPSVYVKPALLTLLVAALALAPGLALIYSNRLSALQATSLSGAILIVLSVAFIAVRQNTIWLARFARA